MLSSRNLSWLGRGTAAVLLVAGAWWLGRSDLLVELLGAGGGDLVIGVVAVSLVLGLQRSCTWWPLAPNRPEFSVRLSGIVSAALGVIVLLGALGEGPDWVLHRFGYGGLAAGLAGGVLLSLSFGRVVHGPILGWAAMAMGIGTAIGAAFLLVDRQGFAMIDTGAMFTAWPITVLACTLATFATHELAFRRLLVGPDGGVVEVLLGALVYAAAMVIIGGGGVLPTHSFLLVFGIGVIAGAAYALSLAPVVSAAVIGGFSGTVFAALPGGFVVGEVAPSTTVGTVVISVVSLIALVLVWKQGGLIGPSVATSGFGTR